MKRICENQEITNEEEEYVDDFEFYNPAAVYDCSDSYDTYLDKYMDQLDDSYMELNRSQARAQLKRLLDLSEDY